MFKVFVLIVSFIKQLIFDCTDEYIFKSYKFNTRKFVIFVILSFSLTINVYLADRLFMLTKKIHASDCFNSTEISQL